MVENLHDTDPLDIGGYRLFGRLGRGGMGVVYLGMASDRSQAAVKVLNPLGGGIGHKDRARFKHEIEAMSAVEHPFLVTVLDSAPDGDPPWFAMEYLDGFSLREWVDANGPLGDTALGTLALCLSDALAALHAEGMIHRDLKPGNVMLTDDGPRIIDFGITLTSEATRMTDTGIVVGTLSFLAPELWHGHPSTPASDVFSLGAVLLFAATGHAPLEPGTDAEMLARAKAARYDTSGIPERWRSLITACLNADPRRRPTAEELFDRLSRTAQVPVPRPRWWVEERNAAALTSIRPSRRRLSVSIIACVTALLAGAAAITTQWWESDPVAPVEETSGTNGAGPVFQLRNSNTGLCLRAEEAEEHAEGTYGMVVGVDCGGPGAATFAWRRNDQDQYRNAGTGQCLTVNPETTKVVAADCEAGLETQIWRPYGDADDMARNAATDYCLHSPRKEVHDGRLYANVNTKECKLDGQFQHWVFDRVD